MGVGIVGYSDGDSKIFNFCVFLVRYLHMVGILVVKIDGLDLLFAQTQGLGVLLSVIGDHLKDRTKLCLLFVRNEPKINRYELLQKFQVRWVRVRIMRHLLVVLEHYRHHRFGWCPLHTSYLVLEK